MTFTSQNIGAKKFENIGKIYRYCLTFASAIGISLGIVGFIFSDQIVAFFSDDPGVIQIGAERMRLVMPFFFFCSLMDVTASDIRGMGKSIEPMIVSLIGACGIRIFWVFFILPLDRTLINLYWSYPVSWAVTFFAQFILFFILKNRIVKKGEI
jgi:Na+-driven multidrug efflux pump